MPWLESSTMDQRMEFVVLASPEGANVAQLCRRFGISRVTGHKWIARYASGGKASLTDLPVLIGATGGTERHSLALDYAMRPLFSYLHAIVVPTAVYAASSDWGSPTTSSGSGLSDRVLRAAGELAALVRDSDRSTRVRDPFALPAGFSPVGAFGAQ